MIGEGRTTGTESSSPKYFGADSMFVSKDDVTQQVVVSESVRMGEKLSYDRHQFTPGTTAQRVRRGVQIRRQLSAWPDHSLRRIGAVDGTHYLTSDEEGWHIGTYSYHFYLPVRVLPEQLN